MIILLREAIKDFYFFQKNKFIPFEYDDNHDEEHLEATINWLVKATENGNGGVASKFNLLTNKWTFPFPETTGYIIPTFWDYYNKTNNDKYRKIAISLTDWLSSVMLANGACIGGVYKGQNASYNPIVFNTGQNIFGYIRSYKETNEEKYLNYALKSGDFLIKSANEDGYFSNNVHNGIPHTYNSRVSWSLLELYNVTDIYEYKEIAIKNLKWTIDQQQKNGFFNNCNFKVGELPNLHGISYTLRGLIEGYSHIKDDMLLESVKLTSKKLKRKFEINKCLYTFWDSKWKNHDKWSNIFSHKYICLTSYAQLGMVFMRLGEIEDDLTYTNTGFKLVDLVKNFQYMKNINSNLYGGIKGAFPIYGRYSIFQYPNWAAKFFADSLQMKIRIKQELLNKV